MPLRCANGFTTEHATEAIAAHRSCLTGKGRGELLKDTAHSRVSLVPAPDGRGRVCVKENRWRSLGYRLKDLLRSSQEVREWRNALRLQQVGVRVPTPLALAARRRDLRRSSAYLVLAAVEEAERLDWYAYEAFFEQGRQRSVKLRFVRELARYLRSLHDAGIYHRDMKPSNVLVREVGPSWEWTLVDLSDVDYNPVRRYKSQIRNLAQWNGSMPVVLSRTDRLRFLRAYLAGKPEEKRLREIWADVLRVTLTRTCIWERDVPVEGR